MTDRDSKDLSFEARAAESLDGLITRFRELGFNILGATCILNLDSGKVVTLSGGRKDVSAISTSLVALLAIVELVEASDGLDDETKKMVAGLKGQVTHYVHAIDSRMAAKSKPSKGSTDRLH